MSNLHQEQLALPYVSDDNDDDGEDVEKDDDDDDMMRHLYRQAVWFLRKSVARQPAQSAYIAKDALHKPDADHASHEKCYN